MIALLTTLCVSGLLVLSPKDPPLQFPERIAQEGARAWSLLQDSLHLSPPKDTVYWSRSLGLWPDAYRFILKRRGYTQSLSGGATLIAISPDLPEGDISQVLAHELTHVFQENQGKRYMHSRHAEALATWAEWRLGYLFPFEQPFPWDRVPLRGFFDIPASVSHSWWPMFTGMPDSTVGQFMQICMPACSERQVDSLMPGIMDSAMSGWITLVHKNPVLWLRKSKPRPAVPSVPSYSVQLVTTCPVWADSLHFRCTKLMSKRTLLWKTGAGVSTLAPQLE